MLHNRHIGGLLKNNKHHLSALRAVTSKSEPLRGVPPFLRWAGSKRQLLSKLRDYWRPEYARYDEPFAGSACFFFAAAPPRALLGDVNACLIETLQTVRDDVESIIPFLLNARRDRELYYKIRSFDPNSLCPAERAARFIYLNRYCFNGLYRTNLQGGFNVPFGADRTGHLPTAEHLRYCSQLLARATLVSADFEVLLNQVRPGDFVYLDPPYVTSTRRIFGEYDSNTFVASDVTRLRRCLDSLSSRGIPFLLSYTACAEGRYLARGFRVERKLVRRSIAGFSGKRVQRQDLLISQGP